MTTSRQLYSPDAARLEMRLLVEAAVDELPGALRTAFVLREVENMPVEDIAEALEMSPDLVRSQHRRAKRLVRESLVREMSGAMGDLFAFAGICCDRIVARILPRLK